LSCVASPVAIEPLDSCGFTDGDRGLCDFPRDVLVCWGHGLFVPQVKTRLSDSVKSCECATRSREQCSKLGDANSRKMM